MKKPFSNSGAVMPPNKMVMCCGCYRLMAKDGKPLAKMRQGPHGLEPVSEVGEDDLACFRTKEECDEGARKAGWKAEGGNHRCPDCVRELEQSDRYGAYVERTEDGGFRFFRTKEEATNGAEGVKLSKS
jgi:hypothetical protein